MNIAQFLQRFRRAWLAIIAVFAIAAVAVTLLDQGVIDWLNPPCAERPDYDAGVDPKVASKLNFLFDNRLLYCAAPSIPFRGLRGPIYWGSDGMSALLFFQGDDLTGVGVQTYLYNDTFVVGPAGESPPEGYGELRIGRSALRNQAPGDHPTYFYRQDGAPLRSDAIANIEIVGPAIPRTPAPVGGRDVWRDFGRIWSLVRRTSTTKTDAGTAHATVAISFATDRWQNRVRRIPAEGFAGDGGAPDLIRLRDARLAGTLPNDPFVFQTASGALGHSLWVANVVTTTHPALALVRPGTTNAGAAAPFGTTGGGDAAAQPLLVANNVSLWHSSAILVPLAIAVFDPLPFPAGVPVEARYWADDARRAAQSPPDRTWTVTFP
ncbi:MAG: hypothetical protein ABI780_03010 [Ardenticatenales bacterium]